MRIAGIDAGGTKTDFLLCDENGQRLSFLTLGSANPNDVGIDACVSLLTRGLSELCSDGAPDAVFAGVSGGGYGEYASRIKLALSSLYPHSVIENGPDAVNLIYCSSRIDDFESSVASLICGTGTAVFIESKRGLFRRFGWGHLFDNGGSGYDFGRDALRALLDAEERPSSDLSTPLFSLLREKLGMSAHDAIPSLYRGGKPYIASFAPLVFEALRQGDPLACSILDLNTDILASRLALVKAEIGNIDEVVCAGGLFKAPEFLESLASKTDLRLFVPDVQPVVGACRRALRLLR